MLKTMRRMWFGCGLLTLILAPLPAYAQNDAPLPESQVRVRLRAPFPTARLTIKHDLDTFASRLPFLSDSDDDAKWRLAELLISSYSTFGYPDEAWRLFLTATTSSTSHARRDTVRMLARDGHTRFLSDLLEGMSDSDPEKCPLVEAASFAIDARSERPPALSFSQRHGCFQPPDPAPPRARPVYRTSPAPPSRPLDRLRFLFTQVCDEPISRWASCWLTHTLNVGGLLAKLAETADTATLRSVIKETAQIAESEIRARALWTALLILASDNRPEALRVVLSAIQSLSAELGPHVVLSRFAIGYPLIAVCPTKVDHRRIDGPPLGGNPTPLGNISCASTSTGALAAAIHLSINGHAGLATEIVQWYERTISVALEGDRAPGTPVDADASDTRVMPVDTVGLALFHAQRGDSSAARQWLQPRRGLEGPFISAAHAFWFALFGVDDVLPAAYERSRARGREPYSSPSFACEWLRALVVRGDVDRVLRVVPLVEPQASATQCVAQGIWLAVLSGRPLGAGMLNVVFAHRAAFSVISPRAWSAYASALIAAGSTSLAERAIVAGLDEGFRHYPAQDTDSDWTGALATLVIEMIDRNQAELVRTLLPRIASDEIKSGILLQAAAVLAERKRWPDVVMVSNWGDLSLASSKQRTNPWSVIARSYAAAGDIDVAFQLIHAGHVDLRELYEIVYSWKSGGRILGP